MNLQSITETVKRPAVWITVVATVLILILWYLLWWSPEGNKLSTENAQISSLKQNLGALQLTLQTDERNQQDLGQYTSLLKTFSAAVPPTPDQLELTTEIASLGNAAGVHITELDVPAVSVTVPGPNGSTSDLSALDMQIVITGTWSQCTKFLTSIYNYPRLMTIQSFTPTPSASPSGTSNVDVINPPKKAGYTFDLSATAYFSPVVSGLAVTSTTAP